MHQGSAEHAEPRGAWGQAQVPGDAELVCRQRPLPPIVGIKTTQLSGRQLGLFCV